MDYLAIDNVRDGTRKCKPLDIGAKYSLEQDETDSHVFYFTGTDGTDVTITTTDTIYSITQSGHSFTLVGSNGYEYTVAIPYDSVSMTQAEYDALTPVQKADGTARFITDAISTEESELWSRVGRGTLHTDAQVISNAVNELASAISELNSSLTNYIKEVYDTTTVTTNENTNTRWDITYTPPSGYTLITAFVVTYGQGTTCILSAENLTPTAIGGYVRRIRGTGDVTLSIKVCSLWRKL
jgi:hypothetical protein